MLGADMDIAAAEFFADDTDTMADAPALTAPALTTPALTAPAHEQTIFPLAEVPMKPGRCFLPFCVDDSNVLPLAAPTDFAGTLLHHARDKEALVRFRYETPIEATHPNVLTPEPDLGTST